MDVFASPVRSVLTGDGDGGVNGWSVASVAVGWIYALSWSLFLIPQMWKNYRRKSTVGFSLDFVLVDNAMGAIPYSIYCFGLYFSPTLKQEYNDKHGADSPTPVKVNDLMLLAVQVASLFVILWQLLVLKYECIKPRPAVWGLVFVDYALLAGAFVNIQYFQDEWNMLDYFGLLGWSKTASVVVKYTPQVHLNWKRQSTVGYSKLSVVFDAVGGSFSMLQMVFDGLATDNFSEMRGNVIKLVVGGICFSYDVVLFMQILLYRGQKPTEAYVDEYGKERRRSLPDPDDTQSLLLRHDRQSIGSDLRPSFSDMDPQGVVFSEPLLGN
jgi:cystinosin